MEKLSGPVLKGLKDDLASLWLERTDTELDDLTWEDVIESIQSTAYAASRYDGLTPAQVIDGQMGAVLAGLIDGGAASTSMAMRETLGLLSAPFCGCLIGWAGHVVGHKVKELCSRDPLFQDVRDGADFAPVEALAFILQVNEQNTPQAELVIRALEQAKAGLGA
jgi:hypothetical protein